jgi:hypothetical protein
MGQVLHGRARTTEAVRRTIKNSQESIRAFARRYGINPKTVRKWTCRCSTVDAPMGPKIPASTVLSNEEEAIIVAFRKYTLLPLYDCLYALQANPAPNTLVAPPLSVAPRHLPAARNRRRKSIQEKIQDPPDRLLPHRHRRGRDRRRQTLPLRRHRSHFEACLCQTPRKSRYSNRCRLPRCFGRGHTVKINMC